MSLHRHVCTSNLSKIPWKYKKFAITQGQKSVTDYLHATRCIPYAYADQIARNSLTSLTTLITNLTSFSPPHFPHNLNKFLRYNPINEFEFFFESIGISPSKFPSLLPQNKFFFSEDGTLLDAACVLSEFGFPWDRIGVLFVESGCGFALGGSELKGRLCELKRFGFCNAQLVGICLAFPFVVNGQQGGEVDALLGDLRRLFFGEFGLAECVERKGNSVEDWCAVCRKIKVLYNLNGGNNIVELFEGNNGVGVGMDVIVEHGEEELVRAIEYFCRFGAKKEDVAQLIVNGSELLELNLETQVVDVVKLLRHFGMSSGGVENVRRDYAHALGTVKMGNLPNVMRALGLHEWFFDKIRDGNHLLLVSFVMRCPDESRDKRYLGCLKAIQATRTPVHNMSKLDFLHGVGFGENALTINVFSQMHGTSAELQMRFDCLLRMGIEYYKVCKMITVHPKILSQNPESLEQKINFFCQEMGYSLERLVTFPAFLCFDLEKRIKPRYKFHMWVKEKGLSSKNYSIASIVATSNRNLVARARKIHPAAAKHWFEQFYPSNLPV